MKKILLLGLCTLLTLSIALYGCKAAEDPGGVTDPGTEPTTTAPETDPETDPGTEPGTEEPGTEPDDVTPAEDLNGTLEEIYAGIIKQSNAEIGMTFNETVTAEMAKNYIGLTAEEMESFVEEALVANAAINVNAHLVAVIKCVDDAAALEVKRLVASGFDSGRWVCVFPEKSVAVEAGQYVLLVSSTAETADAVVNGFDALANGAMGEPDAFYSATNG